MTQQLADKLKGEMEIAAWKDLRTHVARDGILLISPSLDLVEVGVAFAQDNKHKVQQWLEQLLIKKPDTTFLNQMESKLDKRFSFLILQPFVLVQELLN